MSNRPQWRRTRAALRRDASSAALWLIVTVPGSFGFWLVAGDIAGVPHSQTRALIVASLVGTGAASLMQVIAGYRLPVFEGPASTYLAAVAVVHASGHARPSDMTGGLLVAAAFVFALGVIGADRLIRRLFTPPVVSAFLVIVVVTVTPETIDHMIGKSPGHSFGTVAAWLSAALVVAIALAGQRSKHWRAYGLLAALIAGSLAYYLIAGFPSRVISSSWTTPSLFPWGAPHVTVAIAAPFLVAGLLASFNTIASVNVMGTAIESPVTPDQERRGLAVHGIAQSVTACFGNVLGNVPRLDSVGVVRLLSNSRREALALASVAIVALAFVSPVVDVLSYVPVPVSAALLAFVLGILVLQGLRQVATLDWRRRWLVFAPAVVPAFIWLVVADSLSQTLQLVTNPLLIGVVLGVVLDRTLGRRERAAVPAESV